MCLPGCLLIHGEFLTELPLNHPPPLIHPQADNKISFATPAHRNQRFVRLSSYFVISTSITAMKNVDLKRKQILEDTPTYVHVEYWNLSSNCDHL